MLGPTRTLKTKGTLTGSRQDLPHGFSLGSSGMDVDGMGMCRRWVSSVERCQETGFFGVSSFGFGGSNAGAPGFSRWGGRPEHLNRNCSFSSPPEKRSQGQGMAYMNMCRLHWIHDSRHFSASASSKEEAARGGSHPGFGSAHPSLPAMCVEARGDIWVSTSAVPRCGKWRCDPKTRVQALFRL